MEVCIKLDQNNIPIPEEIAKTLVLILNNQNKIMSAIDDLKEQAANLQTQMDGLQQSLDAEQAQIAQLLETNAQVVVDLNTQITNLNAQIAAGATPEQIREVATALTDISESITTTRTDLEGTVADAAPQG